MACWDIRHGDGAVIVLLLIIAVLSAGRSYTRLRDQIYSTPMDAKPLGADVYLPKQSESALRPAVLVVHGGAWCSGERWQIAGIARRLARAGYVAVSVTYRLAPTHRFPAQVEDLQQALRWIHQHAAEYHIDAARIGAWGYSAGAHLVTMLGVLDSNDPLYDPKLRLRAIVAGGTPADLRLYPGGTLVPQFLGARLKENPELFRQASPAARVHAGTPPMFLYHGRRDRLVPPSHALSMQKGLAAAGVEYELRWLSGRGHIGAYLFDRPAGAAALHFLSRHLRTGEPLQKSDA